MRPCGGFCLWMAIVRAVSSPAPSSPACCSKTASPSAWTAKAHGATTSLSNGFGDRSNGKRCTSELTTRCPRLALRSAPISNFTIADGPIRASTGGRQIRLTSAGCRMSRRRNRQMGIVVLGLQRRRREGCGHDALRAAKLGQRESVAHLPTARAEDTAQGCMIGSGKTQSGFGSISKERVRPVPLRGSIIFQPRQGFHL